ncbi:MAG: hypothetical protein KGL65_10625, partial [Rhodospirillales bacterium]|nr:hypothetical protein [Rhodospirillales bacterium]
MFAALESLNTEENNLPPMPESPDEDLFQAHCDMRDCDDQMHTACAISDTIDHLHHLHDVISQHGVSPSLLAFADKDGKLSSAIPEFAAIGAMESDAAPDSAEAESAKKSVMAKIAAATAAWFKHAWDGVVAFGGKLGEFAKAAYARVASVISWGANKVVDGAKAAKEKIAAYPIASVVAGLVAAAGVGLLVKKLLSEKLPENEGEYTSFVKLTHDAEGPIIDMKVEHAPEKGADVAVRTGEAASLGYVQAGWKKITELASHVFGKDGVFATLGKTIADGAKHMLDAIKARSGDAAKYGRKAYDYLMGKIRECGKLPGSALKMFMAAVAKFKGLFGGEAPARVEPA